MGLPLGIIPDQEFVQTVIPIQKGDTWVLYTDGVTGGDDTGTRTLRDKAADKVHRQRAARSRRSGEGSR